jgi:hypothetical protein
VEAGECKRFVLLYRYRPHHVTVGMFHSRNLPPAFSCYRTGDEHVPVVPGIFPGDTSTFSKAGEIIVDNEDAGFHVEGEAPRRTFLPEWMGKKERVTREGVSMQNRYSWNNPTRRWVLNATGDAYGYPTRSFLMRAFGEGKSSAVWTTRIPRAGYYEISANFISIYSSHGGQSFSSFDKGSYLDYTVHHGEEKSLVRLDGLAPEWGQPLRWGWMSLGRFYLPEGETSVSLSDKGGKAPSSQVGNTVRERSQLIIADAIKWRYVDDEL